MRVTEKGQITIPKELRDALGIGAGTEVEFERRRDVIVVRKARPLRVVEYDSRSARGGAATCR